MSITLSKSQLSALAALKSGANCFLDGLAGTGKTFLLDYYTKYYCVDKKVLKCCFTANAVNNLVQDKPNDVIGTIHTCFKFAQLEITSVISNHKLPPWWLSRTYFSKFDVVIIDEISMVRIDYFAYIAKIIAKANKYRKVPIQVIVSGDFCQLPPIMTEAEAKILAKKYLTNTGYAFEHECWKAFNFKVINLDTSMRVVNDKQYLAMLNNLRLGLDLDTTLAYFNRRVIRTSKIANTVRLFATNRLVDKTNLSCLNRLKGKALAIPAYYDNEVRSAIKHHKLDASDLPGSLCLTIKPNCQIMFIKNDKLGKDNGRRFVNGDLGIVIRCDSPEEVVVKVNRTGKLVHLHKYNLAHRINKQPKLFMDMIVQDEYLGLFKQYPIKLAYALTIHKAQGKTFDSVIFDPSIDKKKLSAGLVYVALSRTKDINSLYLTKPLTLDQIKIDPKVVEFYKSLKASK
ncbi:MAG: ATP-dependent DNA helicase [Mycoplasmoidaceae bacterium]